MSRCVATGLALGCLLAVCMLPPRARAGDGTSDLPSVLTHNNTTPAGTLKDGVLTVRLTFKEGAWHPDADDGPGIPVLAFAEEDGPPSVPGPLIRVPAGTRIHVYLHNGQIFPMVVHGFDQRPGNEKNVITIPPGKTTELDCLAGEPGTYFYWATAFAAVPLDARPTEDTSLTGAFIVDPPGARIDDNVMVIGLWYSWMVPMDFSRAHGFHEILTINGKSFPYTERLSYTVGETAHWRVINPSVAAHPMHLHGAFFEVNSDGDGEKDTIYKPGQQRTVVTELMKPGRTMAVSWAPVHAGTWVFHCHLLAHMDPIIGHEPAAVMGAPSEHGDHAAHMVGMSDMNGVAGMSGLVVAITVNPKPTAVAKAEVAPVHRLTMTLSRPPESDGKPAPIHIEVRDGDHVTATTPGALVGPTLVVHRGEPTEITVVNHLSAPTTLHWHGIELQSRYDGVAQYSGNPGQITRPIEAGETFVVRMTPPRAGTFMYHTHWHDVAQLTHGLYGPLLVLEPGQKYDPEHDRVFILGRGPGQFLTAPLLVDGVANPPQQEMRIGEKYRLRFLNITPNDSAIKLKLMQGAALAHWRPVAKDGAYLPAAFTNACEAKQTISVGETYDFEVVPQAPGDMKLSVAFLNHNPTVPIHVQGATVLTKK